MTISSCYGIPNPSLLHHPVYFDDAYKVVTPPVNPAISLATIKSHLRISPADTSQDDYLTLLLNSAVSYFERLTGVYLINTGLLTYRDCFPCGCVPIELRRVIVQPANVVIQYLKDGSLNTFDSSKYFTTNETGFAHIHLNKNESWPIDSDCRVQSIQITYTAGFGVDDTDIPSDLVLALLQHIASLYSNRGDCDGDACGSALPSGAADVYTKYQVIDIGALTNICRNCCG